MAAVKESGDNSDPPTERLLLMTEMRLEKIKIKKSKIKSGGGKFLILPDAAVWWISDLTIVN